MAVGTAMPQDVFKYKAKFIGNFTIRQSIFYSVGVALGMGVFFGAFGGLHSEMRNIQILVTACVMVPIFLWGTWAPFGQPLEKIVGPFITENVLSPAIRRKEVHFEELDRRNRTDPKEKPIVPAKGSGYVVIR